MTKRTCGDCVFYDRGKDLGKGSCRFNPPTLIATQQGMGSIYPTVMSEFKACHQYQPDSDTQEVAIHTSGILRDASH